ncbi:enamidase [Vibrio ponticus]|nr:enamidase [Vibrio ponticus]
MKKFALSTLALAVTISAGCSQINQDKPQITPSDQAPITLFVADQVITMSDQHSDAINAIAVKDGVIIDVGQQQQLVDKYSDHANFVINRDYQNSVITPGFVEPHLHIWLSGILMGTEFITPADWNLPHGEAKGVQTEQAYLQRLNQLHANTPAEQPLITWGYHQYFHGENMSRDLLDSISTERPIIVWHRSFHEIYFNSAALAMFNWQESDWQGDSAAYDHLHWDKGHAYENGAKVILADVLKFLIESGTFATGMERTKEYIHSGGITTAVDPGVIITPEMYQKMTNILLEESLPMDYWLIPAGNFTYSMAGYDAEKGKQLAELQTEQFAAVEQIQWLPKYIKLFSDGAMYSQLMQLKDGYIDGHHGEWLQTPAELEDSMRLTGMMITPLWSMPTVT